MCRVSPKAVVPFDVALCSISDVVHLMTMQVEQLRAYLPDHEMAARLAFTEALDTATLLRKQLVAIQEGMKEPEIQRGSSITIFDGNE